MHRLAWLDANLHQHFIWVKVTHLQINKLYGIRNDLKQLHNHQRIMWDDFSNSRLIVL